MIRDSWFVPGILLLTLYAVGCNAVPSRGQWLTPAPKTPPPPVERVLGQVASFDDFSGPAVTPIAETPHPFSPSHPSPPSPPVADAMPDLWGGPVLPAPPVPTAAYNPFSAPAPPTADDPWSVAARPNPPVATAGPVPPSAPDLWSNRPPPLSSMDDPWGIDRHTQARESVSLEAAAQKEEEERERARLAEVAMANHRPDGPRHLQPLTHWAGPFADRERKQNIEQDIILQAGYVAVSQSRFDNSPVYDWEKEEQKGFDWAILDPVNFFTKVRDWIGMGPDERKANAAMKKGHEILSPYRENGELTDRKIWAAAAKEFWTAAWRWPDSVLEEDALHLAGECYFFAGDYPNALKSYERLLVKYQHSKHIDADVRRVFAIARFWEQESRRSTAPINMTDRGRPTFDTFGNSKKAYETIFINDPNGPISDDAVMALASAYLARGRYQGDDNYDQAAYYFSYLRENFPLSKHIARAHELETYARANAYMGPEYNRKMLDEAGKLAEITLRQFGDELSGDTSDILAIKESVITRQAHKEWVYGQYYDKKKLYGAARQYYEKLLDKYPQTEFAEKARIRLVEIEGLPPQPSQFVWLEKIFLPRGR